MTQGTDSRLVRVVIIGWASFLPASVATMLFFAAFDPQALAAAATFPAEMSRLAGYTLGFFFFWGLAASAATLAIFLLRGNGRRRA